MSFGKKIRKDVEWGEITIEKEKEVDKETREKSRQKSKTSDWLIDVEGKKMFFEGKVERDLVFQTIHRLLPRSSVLAVRLE
jgi:hypothetical protein